MRRAPFFLYTNETKKGNKMESIDRYQVESMETSAGQTDDIKARIGELSVDLFHSIIGLQDEIGEIAKAVKGHVFYGRKLDLDNLIEEYGDVAWYWQLGASSIGVKCSQVLAANRRKLADKKKGRYKKGVFTESEANDRDTEAESVAMQDTQATRAAHLLADAIRELTPIDIHLDNAAATQIVTARTMVEDAFEILAKEVIK